MLITCVLIGVQALVATIFLVLSFKYTFLVEVVQVSANLALGALILLLNSGWTYKGMNDSIRTRQLYVMMLSYVLHTLYSSATWFESIILRLVTSLAPVVAFVIFR